MNNNYDKKHINKLVDKFYGVISKHLKEERNVKISELSYEELHLVIKDYYK